MSNAKNINEVSVITSVDSGDYVMVSDISDDSLKRATVTNVGKTLLGTTDISAIGDGTVTGAISALNSITILNQNITFSDAIFSCDEYFRYSRIGKMVIIDFGGITASNTATGVTVATIPYAASRTVTALFYDQASQSPVMLMYTSGTFLVAQVFQANVRCYGQMVYLTT